MEMDVKTRLIKKEWYDPLEFLARQLTEDNVIELTHELCRGYFEAKKEEGDEFYNVDGFYDHLDNFHLASKLIGGLNPSMDKLPVEFLDELFLITIDRGFFWGFDGKTKTYIYQYLSFEEKEAFTKEIIKGYWQGGPNSYDSIDERNHILNNFKFDLEGVKFVLNELSENEEDCYQVYMSPKDLASYLKKEESVTNLLVDYLNSTKPNKDYVAEIVVNFKE